MQYDPILNKLYIVTPPTDPQGLKAYNEKQDRQEITRISALILNANDPNLVQPKGHQSKLEYSSTWLDAKIAEWRLNRSESSDSEIVDKLLSKIKALKTLKLDIHRLL